MSPTDSILDLYAGRQYIVSNHALLNPIGQSSSTCQAWWDAREARFTPCFLPIISAIPLAVAIAVLLCHLIIWTTRSPPSLLRPFVHEQVEPVEQFLEKRKRPYCAIFLLGISVLGCVIQTIGAFHPFLHLQALFPALAWAIAGCLIAICRPRSTPVLAILLYASVAITALINVLHVPPSLSPESVSAIVSLLLAVIAIVIIFNMPLRDERLPKAHDISAYGTTPDHLQRSPEDNITLLQWFTVSWLFPLIKVGGTRRLEPEDVWSLGYEFQHRRLHENFRDLKGTVLSKVVRANFKDVFVILPLLSLFNLFLTFASPLLLQQLLKALEFPASTRQAALTYAGLSLVVRLIQAQIGVMNIWYSRRAYERSRGEMILMVTEKTLRRKTVAIPEQSEKSANPVTTDGSNEPLNDSDASETPIDGQLKGNEVSAVNSKSILQRLRKFWRIPFRSSNVVATPALGSDAKEAASRGKILSLVRSDVYEVAQRFWEIDSVVSIPLGFVFSVTIISRLVGFRSCAVGIVEILVFQVLNAGVTKMLLSWERKRRVVTDERLTKVSQLFQNIRHLRWYGWESQWLAEVFKSRERELHLRLITGLLSSTIGALNVLASQLLPCAIFAAFILVENKQLRVDIAFPALTLFAYLQDSLRDIPGLITAFLNASVAMRRIQDFCNEEEVDDSNWDNDSDGGLALRDASFSWPGLTDFVLHGITLDFPTGLTLICGEVGAGKTAIILSVLSELELRSGHLIRPKTSLSYCAQSPWLQSQSLRENILFGDVFDEHRYMEVIDACELYKDLADFKHGDRTLIGEGGIGLSGGQRARVALARAVYNRSEYVLLDDPFSALDTQTGELIVRKLLHGPLLKNRITILVTHRVDYFKPGDPFITQTVQITQGRAEVVKGVEVQHVEPTQLLSVPTFTEKEISKQEENSKQEKFEEHRAHGGIKSSIYWEYIKAGRLILWIGFILILGSDRLTSLLKSWWLKAMGEAYKDGLQELALRIHGIIPDVDPGRNPTPWLLGLLIISLTQSLLYIVANISILFIIRSAGRSMFIKTMEHVVHAKFRYFDITPSGVLLNRVTGDMGAVDGGNLSRLGQAVLFGVLTWLSSVAVFSTTSIYFLIVAVAVVLGFVFIFRLFLPTSQSLRRLEMTSLTPLLSNFGVMLDGLMTIRAFQKEYTFLDRVIAVTDSFQKMDHFYWSLQMWLSYRLDILSGTTTFVLAVIAIWSNLSAGLTAFVLVAAAKFVTSTHSLAKNWGQVNLEFVSVERIVEMMHVEQEPKGTIKPPASWPTGSIEFEDVTIRYAPHLDPSLSNLNFTIERGSSVAVIGRTGSGKSSMALSLLATIYPGAGEGRILIDGIDISKVDKMTLRQRITFLAQDPVLFPGSMHQNLDPLSEHSEQECDDVLQKVGGSYGWSLSTKVENGGNNLSQGQRQLVGLARAILRRSSIVILDEATASIDYATSSRIQELLREELKGSTLITIAHRASAVRGADFVIELAKGRVIRQGRLEDVLGDGDAMAGTSTPGGKE